MLQKEMGQLQQELTVMARTAESIFGKAVRVIENKSEMLAKEILQDDTHLDRMELSLDRLCMHLLELKGPYAVDFRFVYSVIKTNKDLERVGDESKTIAKWAHRTDENDLQKLIELAEKSYEALSLSIHSLVEGDSEMARQVLSLELIVDQLEDDIIENQPGLATGLIARALERVSDMATNIAENVIFSIDAKDVRHGGAITI